MKEFIDPTTLITYLKDMDTGRSALPLQAASALEELLEANNELAAAVIRSGAKRKRLLAALRRISTGDKGDWSCTCPASEIAQQALEE